MLPIHERRAWWFQTGALHPNGEFVQFLHVFGMPPDASAVASIVDHRVYPWVPVMEKPLFAELEAISHMTKFASWPDGWDSFMEHVRRSNIVRPYWMLLSTSRIDLCAQVVVGIKRRVTHDYFRNATAPFNPETFNSLVAEAMRVYEVKPTGDDAYEVT